MSAQPEKLRLRLHTVGDDGPTYDRARARFVVEAATLHEVDRVHEFMQALKEKQLHKGPIR